MSWNFRLAALILPILVAGALLQGCGATVLDDVKSEDAIQVDLEESLERQIATVDCPSDQEVETGATFDCQVRFSDGEQATATLKILNEDADVTYVGIESNE